MNGKRICESRNPKHLQGRSNLSWEPSLGEGNVALSRPARSWRSARNGPRDQPGHGHSYVTISSSTLQGVCCLPHKRPMIIFKCGTQLLEIGFHRSGPLPWWEEIRFFNQSAIKHRLAAP